MRRFVIPVVFSCLTGMVACTGENTSSAQPAAAVHLQVDLGTKYQTMEAWRMTARVPPPNITPETTKRILDDLAFDLRLNGLRLPVHYLQKVEDENDNDDPFDIQASGFAFSRPFLASDGSQTIDPTRLLGQIVVPLKQRVENRGEPFSTYVSPHYKFEGMPPHWHNPEEYAEFAEAYAGWLHSQFGFYPTYWAIVNEPDRPFFTSGELEKNIVAVAKRFESRKIPTRIQAPETVQPNVGGIRQLAENPEVAPIIGLISFHGYDYQSGNVAPAAPRNRIRRIARELGVRTAMTEICCKNGWDGGYEQSLGYARDIHWSLTEADVSIWEPLGLFNPGQVSWDSDGKGYQHKPPYYALRQYSRFIRPGYVRVDVACLGCRTGAPVGQMIKPVAFRSPSGKTVLVLINDQRTAQEVEIVLSPGSYLMTGVDPEMPRGRIYSSQQVSASRALKLTLPAQAIITLAQE